MACNVTFISWIDSFEKNSIGFFHPSHENHFPVTSLLKGRLSARVGVARKQNARWGYHRALYSGDVLLTRLRPQAHPLPARA
jgi:hypothetical protein